MTNKEFVDKIESISNGLYITCKENVISSIIDPSEYNGRILITIDYKYYIFLDITNDNVNFEHRSYTVNTFFEEGLFILKILIECDNKIKRINNYLKNENENITDIIREYNVKEILK